MTQITTGKPEDQLRGPFETFMDDAAQALGWKIVCTGEMPLPDRIGKPDYAVHLNKLLAGYVEPKDNLRSTDLSKVREISSVRNNVCTFAGLFAREYGLLRMCE